MSCRPKSMSEVGSKIGLKATTMLSSGSPGTVRSRCEGGLPLERDLRGFTISHGSLVDGVPRFLVVSNGLTGVDDFGEITYQGSDVKATSTCQLHLDSNVFTAPGWASDRCDFVQIAATDLYHIAIAHTRTLHPNRNAGPSRFAQQIESCLGPFVLQQDDGQVQAERYQVAIPFIERSVKLRAGRRRQTSPPERPLSVRNPTTPE